MIRSGRRTRRRRGRPLPKWPILIAVAAAVIAGVLVWRHFDRGQETAAWENGPQITAAGTEIPTVSFAYGESFLNPQHGYLLPLDVGMTHGSIVPLADRTVRMRIEPRGCEILGASYELLDLSGEGLVAQGDDVTLTAGGDAVFAETEFPTLVSTGTEYMLQLKLHTSEQETVYYYTRVRVSDDLHLQEILDFAGRFSDATFDRENGRDRILAYLESDVTVADNTNLGYVDLKNSYRQISWGALSPERPQSMETTIHDLWHFPDGSCAAAVTFDYWTTAADEDGRERTYAVTEYYLMRQYDEITGYLLDYYRTVNDITPLSAEDVSEGRVSLGIRAPEMLPAETAVAGRYAAFEAGGRLYEYTAGRRGRLTLLYDPYEESEGRISGREEGCRIISVDGSSGDVTFTVYGYLDHGPRQGCCGLGLYRYDRSSDRVTELFFAASETPFDIIREELSQLSGAGADGTYYFFYNNGIYAITPGESEPAAVAQGLDFDSFAVSSDGTRVAWADDSGNYGYHTVHLMDLEHDLTFDTEAEPGEELLIEGFTGHDLVLGLLRPEDAGTDTEGNAICPLYALSMRSEITSVANRNLPEPEAEDVSDDEETAEDGSDEGASMGGAASGESGTVPAVEVISLEEVSFYGPDGYYIRAAETDDSHVTIHRLTRNGGTYTDAGTDSLLRTGDETTAEEETSLRRTAAEIRQTVWDLQLFSAADAGENVTLSQADGPEASADQVGTLAGRDALRNVWLAYARGRLVGAFGSLDEAQDAAYPGFGLVIDASGERVWSRLSANAAAPASAQTDEMEDGETEIDDGGEEPGGDAGEAPGNS